MARKFQTLSEFYAHGFDAVLDVRSPAEFAQDHIPGAINLPALNNEERAEVGTIYVQDSPFKARKLGAALVAENVARHLRGPLAEMDGSWQPLVYCWRGGQRSGSFASILSQIGWRAETVEGGYRSYRRQVVASVYDVDFDGTMVLLDGSTGTAKTDILGEVERLGGQILDLEGLAHHRGSLFGGFAGGQPSQKAFEGKLAQALAGLNPARPVLVEAESSKIGELMVPPTIWDAMKRAPRIRVSAPLQARADYLMRAYRDVISDGPGLAAIIERLRPLHSSAQISQWLAMAKGGDFGALAQSLMEEHYDPRYRKSGVAAVAEFALEDLSEAGIAGAAEKIYREMQARWR